MGLSLQNRNPLNPRNSWLHSYWPEPLGCFSSCFSLGRWGWRCEFNLSDNFVSVSDFPWLMQIWTMGSRMVRVTGTSCLRRFWTLYPWKYSEAIWTLTVGGCLDLVTSTGPSHPQPFWRLEQHPLQNRLRNPCSLLELLCSSPFPEVDLVLGGRFRK